MNEAGGTSPDEIYFLVVIAAFIHLVILINVSCFITLQMKFGVVTLSMICSVLRTQCFILLFQ